MKKIIAKKNFTFNGIAYITGDEIKVNSIKEIVKLNEKGFIEPLNYEELTILKRELQNNYKKEDEEWN